MRGTFGLEEFRPGQEDVIRSVVDGRDTHRGNADRRRQVAVLPAAALHLPGTTVVVSPLIALMKDQTDKLNELGVSGAPDQLTLSPPPSSEPRSRPSPPAQSSSSSPRPSG